MPVEIRDLVVTARLADATTAPATTTVNEASARRLRREIAEICREEIGYALRRLAER